MSDITDNDVIEYHQLLNNSKRLRQLQNEITEEIDRVYENVLYLYLTIEIREFSDLPMLNVLENTFYRFKKRFIQNTSTTKDDDWIGVYMYSYGDIIHDERNDKKAIVVEETKCFITMWYFEDRNYGYSTKRRNKYDDSLRLLKRIDI